MDEGMPDPLHVSLAKCTANEMAKKVTDLAIQIHGGNGYTEEYGLERLHRDSHGWAIAGGTPAMQRTRIVSEILGRRFSGDVIFAGGSVSIQALPDCRLDDYADTVIGLAELTIDQLFAGHGEPMLEGASIDIAAAAASFAKLVPPRNFLS